MFGLKCLSFILMITYGASIFHEGQRFRFGFSTTNGLWANSESEFTVTLWYYPNTYQCKIFPSGKKFRGQLYTCDSTDDTYKSCDSTDSTNTKYGMQIGQETGDDATVNGIYIEDLNTGQKINIKVDSEDIGGGGYYRRLYKINNINKIPAKLKGKEIKRADGPPKCSSLGKVVSSSGFEFGFRTSSEHNADSGADFTVTLYYYPRMFQCTIQPLDKDTLYMCDVNDITQCTTDFDFGHGIKYGMQIGQDTDAHDEVYIQEILINDLNKGDDIRLAVDEGNAIGTGGVAKRFYTFDPDTQKITNVGEVDNKPECKSIMERDCSAFAIDDYLNQCSVLFPAELALLRERVAALELINYNQQKRKRNRRKNKKNKKNNAVYVDDEYLYDSDDEYIPTDTNTNYNYKDLLLVLSIFTNIFVLIFCIVVWYNSKRNNKTDQDSTVVYTSDEQQLIQ